MAKFDPNAPGALDSGIFGLPYSEDESRLILIPVPWEVTTSYGGGTAEGPRSIRRASLQLDLYDRDFGTFYEAGIFMREEDASIRSLNDRLKPLARRIIDEFESQGELTANAANFLKDINRGSEEMVAWLYNLSREILAKGRFVAVVGGDHSTPLGAIKALCEKHPDMGILHVDAHADLRDKYEGFAHSHASIMRNVMELPQPPKKLVQIGIRDFCQEEADYIRQNEGRIRCFFDRDVKTELFTGTTWDQICERILSELPEKVYLSFDIDGLSPEFCPHTGTPVAGGLSFDQAIHLLVRLARSGRKVIGFDLNEVAPGGQSDWDANVGARVLYKLCGTLLASQTSSPQN